MDAAAKTIQRGRYLKIFHGPCPPSLDLPLSRASINAALGREAEIGREIGYRFLRAREEGGRRVDGGPPAVLC